LVAESERASAASVQAATPIATNHHRSRRTPTPWTSDDDDASDRGSWGGLGIDCAMVAVGYDLSGSTLPGRR
jgi:hypothetical protein